MLPRVAGKHDPAFASFHQLEKFQHLPATNLASFIHDQDGSRRHRLSLQEPCDRLRVQQPIALKVKHLLPLRSQDDDLAALALDSSLHAAQNITLARSRAAAEERYEIT